MINFINIIIFYTEIKESDLLGKMEQLFVYGTLSDPKVQEVVLGRQILVITDRLFDHVLSFIVIEGTRYKIAQQGKGSVPGYVLEVSKNELELIDVYETTAYCRKQVTLESGRTAWVYCT